MTLLRMDNVLLVVDDLKAAIAFFAALGLELEGEATVEGKSVDRLVGLDGVRSDIVLMRTPDGHGRLELDKFHTPPAVRAEPEDAPVNALGIRRIMFAVDDIDAVLARLRTHGAELVGEVVQYEDRYSALLRPRPRGHHRRAGRAARVRIVFSVNHTGDHWALPASSSHRLFPCTVRSAGANWGLWC